MSTGIYTTTDPNVRIRVVQDDDFHDDPHYAEDVREALLEAYEAGDVYGVIVEKRHKWENVNPETAEVREKFEWEEEESIWSCASYENVAEEVAKEYWDITVTGRE